MERLDLVNCSSLGAGMHRSNIHESVESRRVERVDEASGTSSRGYVPA